MVSPPPQPSHTVVLCVVVRLRGCVGVWVRAREWRERVGTCAFAHHEAMCCGLNCCTVSTEVSGESMNSDSICSVALKAEMGRMYV